MVTKTPSKQAKLDSASALATKLHEKQAPKAAIGTHQKRTRHSRIRSFRLYIEEGRVYTLYDE